MGMFVLLRFIFKMDAVIRQALQDKLRHKSQTQSDTYNQNVEDSTTTSSNQHTECTERRLSRLFNRIRTESKYGGFILKTNQKYLFLYVTEMAVEIVFFSYNVLEPPTMGEIKQKACTLFFPHGKSAFLGQSMICF